MAIKRRLNQSTLEKIIYMLKGNGVAASSFPLWLARELRLEGLLTMQVHGSRSSYHIIDPDGCRTYLSNTYTSGQTLETCLKLYAQSEDLERSTLVQHMHDSKYVNRRTFRGFLVNCYEPIEATLNDDPFLLNPVDNTAVFIQEPQNFRVPEDVLIVGMENAENFHRIRAQKYLFETKKVLFVSRYPQTTDLRRWLESIPNKYLHFGDFDLAGINIFLQEYQKFLKERASFLIPPDIEKRLKRGNSMIYDIQIPYYQYLKADDPRLQALIDLINQYRKGYEQEGYIRRIRKK